MSPVMSNAEVEAIIHGPELAEDFADEIFEDDDELIVRSLELDFDRDPYGWNITDRIDWDSQDYEYDD